MQLQVKLQHVKHQLWLLFQDKSDGVVNTAVQLYKSADLYIDFTISLDPVDGFWQLKSHFGVIFDGQPNYKVTVHIS